MIKMNTYDIKGQQLNINDIVQFLFEYKEQKIVIVAYGVISKLPINHYDKKIKIDNLVFELFKNFNNLSEEIYYELIKKYHNTNFYIFDCMFTGTSFHCELIYLNRLENIKNKVLMNKLQKHSI